MTRVLISEELADGALDTLRSAGLDADVQLGLSRSELLAAVDGAAAIIVRSATQVDDEVLAAGGDLVVVGRAGIGLDNVDVEAATRRGVMIVNAPQSNILSAAEHTMALLLSQARNVAAANADLKAGNWNRSQWKGVELHGKTLGVVGLGRIGVLVAQRALAFGMRLTAYDPYVSADRARQLGVELVEDLGDLVAEADFVVVHLPKTPDTAGLVSAEVLARAKPSLRIVNTARGGIVDEAALADALSEGRIAGAALDVFVDEPPTDSPLLAYDTVVVTPHLGASTAEAQDKAGRTIADQVARALAGELVPFAVNVAATEMADTVRPFLGLAERLGRLFTALADGAVDSVDISYEGQIAGYDCGVLTLGILRGMLAPVVDEPVSFVNAPQMAADRGVQVRETTSSSTQDYVNLISLRGVAGGEPVHVSGTLYGKQEGERIVGIDEHVVDLPPARHMIVVRNDDVPGVIGRVGTILGEAGVNIADMDVGRTPGGVAALMAISTSAAVSDDVLDALRAEAGIISARGIDLD